MTIPATLAKWADVIVEVEDDRGTQNGWWIYLKAGWINPYSETHCVHEDTLKACASQLVDIQPCECTDCLALRPDLAAIRKLR